MRHFLFTYGSLQPGKAPAEIADVVAGLEIVGRGFVLGTLQGEGPYPGVVLDEVGGDCVPGTIYRLPEDLDVLRKLDEYEEYFPDAPGTSEFLRVLHPVYWEDGRVEVCWIYVLNEKR